MVQLEIRKMKEKKGVKRCTITKRHRKNLKKK